MVKKFQELTEIQKDAIATGLSISLGQPNVNAIWHSLDMVSPDIIFNPDNTFRVSDAAIEALSILIAQLTEPHNATDEQKKVLKDLNPEQLINAYIQAKDEIHAPAVLEALKQEAITAVEEILFFLDIDPYSKDE